MAHGPRFRVKLKRRRNGKTDYYQRRDLLKSGRTRAVVRKTAKNFSVQFVDAKPNGDITLSSASTRQLKNYGWNVSGGNIPAAYLTGYLAGKKAVKAGVDDAIADLGLQITSKGGRIFAAVKGIIDAGIKIPANESVFPEDDVLHGAHIIAYAKFLKENNKEALDTFAKYKGVKQKVEALDKLVDKTKTAIDKEF